MFPSKYGLTKAQLAQEQALRMAQQSRARDKALERQQQALERQRIALLQQQQATEQNALQAQQQMFLQQQLAQQQYQQQLQAQQMQQQQNMLLQQQQLRDTTLKEMQAALANLEQLRKTGFLTEEELNQRKQIIINTGRAKLSGFQQNQQVGTLAAQHNLGQAHASSPPQQTFMQPQTMRQNTILQQPQHQTLSKNQTLQGLWSRNLQGQAMDLPEPAKPMRNSPLAPMGVISSGGSAPAPNREQVEREKAMVQEEIRREKLKKGWVVDTPPMMPRQQHHPQHQQQVAVVKEEEIVLPNICMDPTSRDFDQAAYKNYMKLKYEKEARENARLLQSKKP